MPLLRGLIAFYGPLSSSASTSFTYILTVCYLRYELFMLLWRLDPSNNCAKQLRLLLSPTLSVEWLQA